MNIQFFLNLSHETRNDNNIFFTLQKLHICVVLKATGHK